MWRKLKKMLYFLRTVADFLRKHGIIKAFPLAKTRTLCSEGYVQQPSFSMNYWERIAPEFKALK